MTEKPTLAAFGGTPSQVRDPFIGDLKSRPMNAERALTVCRLIVLRYRDAAISVARREAANDIAELLRAVAAEWRRNQEPPR